LKKSSVGAAARNVFINRKTICRKNRTQLIEVVEVEIGIGVVVVNGSRKKTEGKCK